MERSDIDGGYDVQTDMTTCCTSTDGLHRGGWYFPNGTRLPFTVPNVDTFEIRETQRVDIMSNSDAANSPGGVYRCDIPTI